MSTARCPTCLRLTDAQAPESQRCPAVEADCQRLRAERALARAIDMIEADAVRAETRADAARELIEELVAALRETAPRTYADLIERAERFAWTGRTP